MNRNKGDFMKNLFLILFTGLVLTACLGGGGGGSSDAAPVDRNEPPGVEQPVVELPTEPGDDVTAPEDETPGVGQEEDAEPVVVEEPDPQDPVYTFGGGTGTQQDPYLLEVAEDILHIGDFPAAHFALQNNINMGNITMETLPAFSGVLYGNNFTIFNFKIVHSTGIAALFQSVSGTLVQLKISNMRATGTTYAAGFAGHVTGMLSSCQVSGTIVSPQGGNGVNSGVGTALYVTKSSGAQVIAPKYNVTFNGLHIWN
jgi:hypothetical protein